MKTTHQNLSVMNTVKNSILSSGAQVDKTDSHKYSWQDGNGVNYYFLFGVSNPGIVTVKKSRSILGNYDCTKQPQVVELVSVVRTIAGSIKAHNEQNKGAGNTAGVKTMEKIQFSVSQDRVSQALTKAGWTKDANDIFESKEGVILKFNPKSVRIHNPNTDVTVNVPNATTTDAALIKYIQDVIAGNKPKMVKTADLQAPVAPSTPAPVAPVAPREQSPDAKSNEPAPAPVAPDKEKKEEKPELVKPENPNEDGSTPIFDSLNSAVATTEKAEGEIVGAWSPIAQRFAYSIKGLTAELHKEGMWPDKLDKNGKPIGKDGFITPAGYKSVYDTEKAAGITTGPGYMVNRASRMFAKLNPESAINKRPDAPAPNSGPGTSTASEKSVDDILSNMSKLAGKLEYADLKSWLETDASVQAIWKELTGNPDEDTLLDALDGLNVDEDELDALTV